MPTAIPIGFGHGYAADYELCVPYVGIGVAPFISLTGGMTLIPGVPVGSEVRTAMLKATILHTDRIAFALGGNILDISTANQYVHLYSVLTAYWDSTWFSGALFFRLSGPDSGIVREGFLGSATYYYTGNTGIAFGFESPITHRTDMRIIGEIWNDDVSNYENTVFMLGIRLSNGHLSSDFGLSFLHLPFFPVPFTNFSYSW